MIQYMGPIASSTNRPYASSGTYCKMFPQKGITSEFIILRDYSKCLCSFTNHDTAHSSVSS